MSFQYFTVCTTAKRKLRKERECFVPPYHFALECGYLITLSRLKA